MALNLRLRPPDSDASRLAAALDILLPDLPSQLARPSTGSALQVDLDRDHPGDLLITLPLLQAPFVGPDLLPSVVAAASSCGAVASVDDAAIDLDDILPLWTRRRAAALAELGRLCLETGSPLPPHLPRSDIAALHGWLLHLHERLVDEPMICRRLFVLDRRDGHPARIAVRVPPSGPCRIPPVDDALVDFAAPTDGHETPLAYPIRALLPDASPDDDGLLSAVVDPAWADRCADEARSLDDARIASVVEVVELEALLPR